MTDGYRPEFKEFRLAKARLLKIKPRSGSGDASETPMLAARWAQHGAVVPSKLRTTDGILLPRKTCCRCLRIRRGYEMGAQVVNCRLATSRGSGARTWRRRNAELVVCLPGGQETASIRVRDCSRN